MWTLISEEAQQDMDLKSAFAPAVPRRAFFRLGTPGRALEEWQMGNELTARSFSKPPLGREPPISGICHMSWSVLDMQPQARIVHWTFGKRRAQQRDRGWQARIAGA